ncbi:glycoside hydrolase family 44 protein [Nannocystis bainbridge]|uniref:glycoside hydrolase family 44 protein n=1 Tax=Nannocystis bainbridge TaxID=2995303 RepID=UPI002804088C|nr:glycoside hydrolase family 44 protein [Nannocystis bainbridge]
MQLRFRLVAAPLALLAACTEDPGTTTALTPPFMSAPGDPTGDPTGSETDGPTTAGPGGDPTTDGTTTAGTTTESTTTETTTTTGPDPGPLVEPGDPGRGDVTFTIRADTDRHPISPWIYGTNQYDDLATTNRGLGLVRQGGNRMTAYNWENNASNAGADYEHQNDDYLASQLGVDGDIPGEVVRAATAAALDAGADMLVTVPICGHVAADKDGGGDVNQSPNYLETRFHPTIARKDGAFDNEPDASDHAVYQDEFVAWLQAKFPDAFYPERARVLFSLDNEPDLWSHTHERIHPDPVGYAELVAKNTEFAAAIKDVAANAIVAGFVSYGFGGFTSLQDAPDAQGEFLSNSRMASKPGLRAISCEVLPILPPRCQPPGSPRCRGAPPPSGTAPTAGCAGTPAWS